MNDRSIEFQLADKSDLESIKTMYKEIVENMNTQGINIWDDIYPCEFFAEDINNDQLYVLKTKDEILSAFALGKSSSGENAVEWKEPHAKAIYLDRLGVNVKYSRAGIGRLMLEKAKEIARSNDAEYLRLFVVDTNVPAIRLYENNNFIKAKGIYEERFEDGFCLYEFGYEIEI
ncbi:GNAT family N-acetyltransferase [uncultured Dubosiella sp.]|uniref:GNAT family N-acetyltransferase n=1 Tax=uncultured Dubosiella sp. TaxID=1937011 RepID=UPI0025DF88F6|nr:GNAT family N-acetyltransferase [uncultured Dubosiella sp.]